MATARRSLSLLILVLALGHFATTNALLWFATPPRGEDIDPVRLGIAFVVGLPGTLALVIPVDAGVGRLATEVCFAFGSGLWAIVVGLVLDARIARRGQVVPPAS